MYKGDTCTNITNALCVQDVFHDLVQKQASMQPQRPS